MQKVFTPIQIGSAVMKNRIVFPSMCTFFCEEDGTIGECMTEYVRERVRGGVGMMIIPGTPHGKPGPGRPAFSDDCYIEGWRKLAGMAHGYGAKLFCQLHPASFQKGRGKKTESPSDFSVETIHELVESYARCAERCKRAGLDGVEIHGAHAHEVAQFMSRIYNTRTDEYGGTPENRARFPGEIIRAIKARCGPDFPVIFRISGLEKVEGGRGIEETAALSKLFEAAGADAIHVSCGMPESEPYISAPMDVDDCFNAENAAVVKRAVSVPVITCNRVVDVAEAEQILESGLADMTSMGRALLADPELIHKYEGSNPDPVRRCLGCNQGCRDVALYRKICCLQNPRLGRESELNFTEVPPERRSLKIMIAGAGPAGLEAAVDLALRGFSPVVYEKGPAPGGLAVLAALPPHKRNMNSVIDYRIAMLKRYGVPVHCGVEVDLQRLEEEKPDVLIAATGSAPLFPKIPGIDGPGVYSADEVIAGKEIPGERVALLGGGLIGCETAEFLAARGKKVAVFELLDGLGKTLNESRRYFMLRRMKEAGIEEHLKTAVREIRLPEIVCESDGEEAVYGGFDAVVSALGRTRANALAAQAERRFPDMTVIAVGDAQEVGVALDAIREAALVAAAL